MKKARTMRTVQKYKVAVGILVSIILLQWVLLWRMRTPGVPPQKPLPIQGEIAIVIDDWGYNRDNLPLLNEIGFPCTVSILPHLPYSKEIARDAQRLGLEVILHLPMEPLEKYRLEENTITTAMDETQIKGIIDADLSDIAIARGANNHMGSKATGDYPTMERVFRELKKRNLFFLDSLVTSKSICAQAAKAIRLPFAKRDVFLDNKEDPAYIRQQLYILKRKAKAFGHAVGIGHDRASTLRVLQKVVPEFQKQGFKFVFVSEIAQ